MEQVNNYEAETHAPKIGNASSLFELAGEFTFYTPALQLLFCELPEDPLGVLCAALGCKVPQFSMQFDEKVFDELPKPFSHTLFGMQKYAWHVYENQLKGITVIDRTAGTMSQLRLRTLQIADPLERQRKKLSTVSVPVVAVCVETNKGCYYIDDTAGLAHAPVFRFTPTTFPDFVKQANSVLSI